MYSTLLLAATTAPSTHAWSPKVAIAMIVCNILVIAIGRFVIKYPNKGPELPSPEMFGGMSLGALLGTTSLGHILGAGTILGLSYLGAL
ncbi:MAG: photosystem I reaction center subunit PsaK [Microcystaceae cyanobacterium]